jgi:predicted methyltransferase
MRKLFVSCTLVAACSGLAACGGAQKPASEPASAAAQSVAPNAAPSDALAAAVAAPSRAPENVARDGARHPAQTLGFFGVTPTQTVVELWPGRGWYTEILAPLLREQGKLYAATPTGDYLQPYKDFLAKNSAVYDRVQLTEVSPPASLSLGPDGSADAVLTFRNVHGWVSNGYAQEVHEAVFRVLKPGGVYGVEEHRAAPGTPAEASAKSGYVSEEAVIAMATKAGLVLEERSELNANPKDTKDYANGVWALPPSLRGGDVDKDKYVAIGESDRMTLRFRKPAQQ